MKDSSLERVSELVRGVIELLWNRPEGLPAGEVITNLPHIVRLDRFEIGFSTSSNMPRYERMIRLAIFPLAKAGWFMKTDKGQWLLTEDGRSACRKFPNSQEFFLEALRLSEKSRQNTPEILLTLDLMRENAWATITNYIQMKTIMELRQLIVLLLESMQYREVWVAPPQKDHGQIDVIANTDPLGVSAYRILVQIKHTGQPVTLEGLKSFLSILGANDFGLFFSTSGFTAEARKVLNKGSYEKINAMDLEKFYDLWIRHFDKLTREAHQHLPLKAIFFLSPLN